ncbi:hypothetical protein HPB51_021815 [Rhipicephalus microplus]|uniref:Transposable element P transposase-like RNase H domain-containing protein n=1 Tax=Rhipicephalus microplus TaxID=6941 RepID=A0A9J6DIP5_RHIMP|nr:hypothetical protein HPB51_021815 [Rhipicephalus microplus]
MLQNWSLLKLYILTQWKWSQSKASAEYVCRNIELPNTSWNKLSFSTETGTVTFGLCEFEGAELDHLLLPKLVKFEQVVEQEKNWVLECVLLRMRSPKLYEHLRKQKILVLPSRTCLQRHVRNFKSGFGFNDTVFKALSAKTESMDVCSRHGGIIFNKLKLSEQFDVNQAGFVERFVNLGSFTADEQRSTPADHGMVMLFQPFQAHSGGITCKVSHPVDSSRELHFCSDFPHLVKCIRNTFVSTGFTTPDGRACIEDIEVAWAKDNSSLTLKAMPHVTRAHIRPNSFETMKANLAFMLSSEEVLKGMFLYRSDLPGFSSSVSASEQPVRRLSRLTSIMTSRCPKRGLRPSSQDVAELEDFVVFLDAWEEASKNVEVAS